MRRLTESCLGEPVSLSRCGTSAPGDYVVELHGAADLAGRRLACAPGMAEVTVVRNRVFVRPSVELARSAVHDWVAEPGPLRLPRQVPPPTAPVMISIGSPNANKPLHVGHLRNCLFGMALAELFRSNGYRVVTTEEISDYGIHICQAITGYLHFGAGRTPLGTGSRPDDFAGHYYTLFHHAVHDEEDPELARNLRERATSMLRQMDAGDPGLLALNRQFTGWAIEGIRRTYCRIGLHHDFTVREEETLPEALQAFAAARAADACKVRPDGSWYADLGKAAGGEVTLFRQDGSVLVIPRCVGVWLRREQLLPGAITVRATGEQWTTGFAQLISAIRLVGRDDLADRTEPVFYGMVSISSGTLRSRDGAVLTIDALLDRVRDHFAAAWERAEPDRATDPYRAELCEHLALGLLSFHILGVPRTAPIQHDDTQMYRGPFTDFATVIAAIAAAEDRGARPVGGTVAPPGDPDRAAVRKLLMHMDGLAFRLDRALERRNPAHMISYSVHLARLAAPLARRGALDVGTWYAVRRVLRTALATVAVSVPPSLRDLPPQLRTATKAFALAPACPTTVS